MREAKAVLMSLTVAQVIYEYFIPPLWKWTTLSLKYDVEKFD